MSNPTKKSKKKSGAWQTLRLALLVSGCLLLGIYAGFAVYYGNRFFPHTTIGGIACGNKTAAYLEAKNIAAADDFSVTVTDRKGNTYTINGSDFGYSYNRTGEEAALLEAQNNLLWLSEISTAHTHDMDCSFSYDADALTALIDALPLFDEDYIEAPEDAYLDITDSGYTVVDEKPGNTPIRDQIVTEITDAVDAQQETLTLSDACYETPSVLASDSIIADTAAALDGYLSSTVSYDIDGADETLSESDILGMLIIGEDGSVTVDDDKLTAFVQHLASTYNTYGDARAFQTSKGDTVTIGGGDYGWVIDKSGEKEELLKDLASGEATEREPVYEQRAMQSGTDDIGNTYVEIDYGNQHLWYYKDGELVTDTDIVSGNINRGNGSPDGVFQIVYKQRDATLIGEDYASDVEYFMPFAYNVGIHDASWRSEFGGEIYKTSGSHGCINVPAKIAKKLYKTLEVGTPVVAYYREEVQLTAENARISNAYSYVEEEDEDTN